MLFLRRFFFVSAFALVCAFAVKVFATATYDYKPGELVVIKGGKSPDKKFSIVSGEDRKEHFGVFLMDAQTKKIIGPLEEVATDLDSAPDAYRAHWSPDSKHVAISSRSDRHMLENVIYRIENRRAYLVETPELRCHAVPDFCQIMKDLGGSSDPNKDEDADSKVRQNENASEIVEWLSPTRFVVHEESQFQIRTRDPSGAIGKYGETEKENADSDTPADLYHVWFEAEGECELLPGDKSQVVSTHPVERKEEE
jgi:hypothetical protein